tara:strand:- start:1414 stop:1830 length:417 start_codon:yes stop_codon:yes gene_type:complete
MKKFKTLEKLIRFKSKMLDERKQFVGKLIARVSDVEIEITRYRTELANEQKAALDSVDAMMACTEYTALVIEKIERLERLRREAETQLQREQDKLMELYADLQSHEKVLTIAKTEHEKALEKKDQNNLDDLYGRKHSF